MIELLSIEVTNRCNKACWFCYNHSQPGGDTLWTVSELVSFIRDCAQHGVKAVSFGGGEPLQYPGLFDLFAELQGVVFRSMTTNGLLLHGEAWDRLLAVAPNKVHLSIHFPDRVAEVQRVIEQVHALDRAGIRSGINLLVTRSQLASATAAALEIRVSGIGNDRIVYLPMRVQDTPTPDEVKRVAGDLPFQSMTCLSECKKSQRFCSIGWDKAVAWCSYTSRRRPLSSLTFQGLTEALTDLDLVFCGGTTHDPGLSRRSLDGYAMVRD